ncbi:hypothetical protein CONLIGDRAFT_318106 [Coniochaeta ligniaria NRRL 30616]|uniref:Uncharacterized protein n=1 Tax=Coniochaeta ligniaria NRRL 30616 TaxID=1408157 RepID=A0A1J7JUK8_9PEZI|nr:hypothetical protein CONLIGDRAFT_318106 [Coniochaeta ligniaria NRRL 30616]
MSYHFLEAKVIFEGVLRHTAMGLWALLVRALSLSIDRDLHRDGASDGKTSARDAGLFSYISDSHFKRDVCADAFGAGASNSECAPSNTLCCKLMMPSHTLPRA